MGILVVLAIGGLAYRYFQTEGLPSIPGIVEENDVDENEIDEEIIDEEVTELPTTHVVTQNESLWTIAERYYLSGYNWVDIAEANNLVNPDILAAGQELTIPDVESRTITVTQLPETGFEEVEITEDTYTVQEGDTLSSISLRAYGDMYSWPRIWGANRDQITHPNFIYPGMVLEIPRD